MLSLYIHIPFCTQKCAYCSFTSFPKSEIQDADSKIQNYIRTLQEEIKQYGKNFPNESIKTLYIGGGTPSAIGTKNILKLIDTVKENFDIENIEEFSIELNPHPQEEVFELVETLNKKLKDFPRVRFSFGIQSLDDNVLQQSGRPYNYPAIVDFLRDLRSLKQDNNVFNFDFIAFGEFNKTRSGNIQLRDQSKLEFLENFVNSGFADSFSLYTLELFEGSKRHTGNSSLRAKKSNPEEKDDLIYEEFQILKEILQDGGYNRYEISNFALPGKNSIHNMVYRHMENYLGLGLGASSYMKDNKFGTRRTNTKDLNKYLEGNRKDEKATIKLTQKDFLIEKFFLQLRTNRGISDLSGFKEILVPNYEEKLKNYEKQGFVETHLGPPDKGDKGGLTLTDSGMDIFNTIITELLKEI